jgi:hypothetical protein
VGLHHQPSGEPLKLLGQWIVIRKPASDLGSRTQPQLLEEVTDVGGNSVLGEHQLRGDLAVGEILGPQERYLLIAPRPQSRKVSCYPSLKGRSFPCSS